MEARARVVYLWSRRINVSVWFPEGKKREEGGGGIEGLTEHLATSSKVRAPWVADRLEEDAILLAAHILCSKNGGRQCGGCWRPCARR